MIKDIINFDDLSNFLQENYNKTSEEMTEAFKRISSPTIHKSYISIIGIQFAPSITIYPNARADEIIEGWNFLLNKQMPIDVYVNASIVHLLHNNLLNKYKNIPVDEETEITIDNEPEILEILRFCYWVYKSRNIIDNENFERKFIEIRKDLKCNNELDTRNRYGRLFIDVGKALQDKTIDYESRLKIANNFYNELNQFRNTISSFLPEFMLPCIIKDEGFEVKFNPVGKFKEYDLLFNSYPAEIKTIVDESKYGKKIEKNLKEEIEITLQRDKSVGKINHSLSQGAEIIFLFLTFSSLGVGFLKHIFKKQNNFSVNNALIESISLAKNNRTKKVVEKIPVIVLTTSIDTINSNYKIFSLLVQYPVKNNKNKLEANPDNLSINLNKR